MDIVLSFEKIKALREAAGLSQNLVAEATGISVASIRNYEAGDCAHPNVQNIACLATLFGMSMDVICGLGEPAEGQAEVFRMLGRISYETWLKTG